MRLKDVEIGKEYAYQEYSGSRKIKVTAEKLVPNIPLYHHWGVHVVFENGKADDVPARCLVSTWAQYATQRIAYAEYARQNEEAKAIKQKMAGSLQVLFDMHGIKASIEPSYDRIWVTFYDDDVMALITILSQ